jgi:hypothetical protein
MALMLRMVGIPSRVVSGFAPGSLDREREVYEVRDFDAHSWVEVYFGGIGWVTFDPTPAAAPAGSQVIERGAGLLELRDRGGSPPTPEERGGDLGAADRAPAGAGGDRAGSLPLAIALLACLAAAGGLAALVAARRRRRLEAGLAAEAQIAELRSALARLGWRLAPGTTLLAIERRFSTASRRGIARYAAALRASRYGTSSASPPGARDRRALRRALGAGSARRRLLALRAIPPGGPARMAE